MAARRVYKRDEKGRFARTNGGSRPKASQNTQKRPVSKAKGRSSSPPAQSASGAMLAIQGINIASSLKVGASYGAKSYLAATTGQPVMAGFYAARGAGTVAAGANDAHHLIKIRTSSYVNGTVEERAKHDVAYQKRRRTLNRFNSATGLTEVLGNSFGPLIQERASARQQEGVGRALGTAIKATKANRHGVYNISSVKGKRVA